MTTALFMLTRGILAYCGGTITLHRGLSRRKDTQAGTPSIDLNASEPFERPERISNDRNNWAGPKGPALQHWLLPKAESLGLRPGPTTYLVPLLTFPVYSRMNSPAPTRSDAYARPR